MSHQSALTLPNGQALSVEGQFSALREVPPEAEWFANIDNPQTRRAYQNDIRQFMQRWAMTDARQFREISRAHILQYRAEMETAGLASSTIRRKLAALSSLFGYLCNAHAVPFNPVISIKRPKVERGQGRTPALSVEQARLLLNAPDLQTLMGLRDAAILSVLLYHGLRRAEVCRLCMQDMLLIRGVMHFRVHGKGNKTRDVPVNPHSAERLDSYLSQAGHRDQPQVAMFQAIHPGNHQKLNGLSPHAVYLMVNRYMQQLGISIQGFGPHSLRATAATTALENGAPLDKVQLWLGHVDPATTKMYDHREFRPADSPSYKVHY